MRFSKLPLKLSSLALLLLTSTSLSAGFEDRYNYPYPVYYVSPYPCCEYPYDCWTGFYLNGQIGYAYSETKTRFTNNNYFNTLGPILLGSKFDFSSNGLVAGGGFGFNVQRDCAVVGMEIGALNMELEEKRSSPFFPTDTYTSNLQWVMAAKLRLGVTCDCFLTYITGGWAGGNVALTLRDDIGGVKAHAISWVNGWTIGGGFEYKLTDCASIGVAYDYVQLQNKNKRIGCLECGEGIGLGTPVVNQHLHAQTVVFRVNYHFGQLY